MPKVQPKNKSVAKTTVSGPAQGLDNLSDDPAVLKAKYLK